MTKMSLRVSLPSPVSWRSASPVRPARKRPPTPQIDPPRRAVSAGGTTDIMARAVAQKLTDA
jgi:hypothetical protein